MGSGYETRTDDWAYKVTGVISAGYGGGGTIVGMDLYSQKTGFLGHTRFYGIGLDLGASSGMTLLDWVYMDISHAFSPRDLHGTRGSVKAGAAGLAIGATHMWATAHMKKVLNLSRPIVPLMARCIFVLGKSRAKLLWMTFAFLM